MIKKGEILASGFGKNLLSTVREENKELRPILAATSKIEVLVESTLQVFFEPLYNLRLRIIFEVTVPMDSRQSYNYPTRIFAGEENS